MILSNNLIKSKLRWLQICIMLGALIVIPLGLTNAQSSATNGTSPEVLSDEAKAALGEAEHRLATDPNNYAAIRKPLIDYYNTHSQTEIPKTLYMMLGQLWYVDHDNDEHLEAANSIYETAYELYPDEMSFLLNYAVTTYEIGQYEDAAALFEDYYHLDEKHDVQFLENAAAIYEMAGNESEAERIRSQLADISQASEHPEETWEDLPISDEAPALISDVDTKPQVLEAFPPPYPDDAKENGIEGRVTLRFVVGTDGYATEPEILEATPPDIFDDAALEAITQYRFQPATKDGMAVACIAKLVIGFALSDS